MSHDEKKLALIELELIELEYELLMLNGTAKRLSALPIFQEGELSALTIERNAYTESFLIHMRNLIDFFEDWKDKKDIRCSDFNIKKVLIQLPTNNTRDEINKFLSHLTKRRIREESPEWKHAEIKKELNKHMRCFIEKIPETTFPKDGVGSKKRFESLLNPTYVPE